MKCRLKGKVSQKTKKESKYVEGITTFHLSLIHSFTNFPMIPKRICISAVLLLIAVQSYSQSHIYINPVTFTQTVVRLYVGACNSDPNTIHLKLNGQDFPHTKDGIGYGFFMDVRWEFGTLKPGDILSVTDDCGSIGHQVTVTDDYVYVEVPAGTGYSGNGIDGNAQFSPYSALTTPVNVGKCAAIPFNAHVLSPITLYSFGTNGGSTGALKINGAPMNPNDFSITHNGQLGVVYSFNANGSWQTNGILRMDGKVFYSGATATTLEYTHNGNENGQFIMGIGGMQFYEIQNGSYKIRKGSYTGGMTETTYTGSFSSSVFKITYDQAYYRAYVNGVLVDELKRFVVYSATNGTVSNTSPLDYRTGVTWTPSASGTQWLTAVVDGVRYVSQKMNVADDMVMNQTVVNVACAGGSTGEIIANVTGGLAPLTYSKNGSAYGSSNTFSNLTAGTYIINAKDASGCVTTKSITVNDGSTITASVSSKTDVVCAGNTNGTATLSQTGGVGPYTYSKDGTNFGNSATISGLSEGNYTFTVKDANGCTATTTPATVIGFQSKLVVGIASQTNANCFGGTGSITISTTGSSPSGSLQYSKDGTNFQSSATFTGLAPNVSNSTYTFTVKDNLCQANTSAVTITQPPNILADLTIGNNVKCFGNSDAVINISASGGSNTFTYSLDNVTYGTATSYTGLSANNYSVWVQDGNGCKKQSNVVTVTQPTVLVPAVSSVTNVSCFGGNNGTVTLSASGGTPFSGTPPTYVYAIGTGSTQTSPTITGLSVGANQVFTIKDANGCAKTITASITQPAAAIALSLVSKTNLSCFQDNTGRIEVSGSGGTSPYQYSKDGTSYQNSAVFDGLAANGYTITIKDAKDCSITLAATISQPDSLKATITPTTNLCNGDNTGKIDISPVGGTSPYQYSKDNGTNYQTAATFTGLLANSYQISIKDSKNCVYGKTITVNQPTVLTASAAVTKQVSCYTGSDATVDITAGGGTSPYQYSKDNGTSFQSSSQFTALAATTYTITTKDANGCIKTTNTVTPTQPSELVPSIVSVSNVKCFGGNDGAIQLTVTGGTSPYQYSKDNGNNPQSGSTFSILTANSYTLTTIDAKGCRKNLTATVTQPAAALNMTTTGLQNLSCYQNSSGQVQVVPTGGTSPYQFSKDGTTFQTSTLFTGLSATSYTLTAKDANNCTFQTSVAFTQPTDISVTLLSKKDIDCNYYARGEFKVSASGSNGNFSYILSGYDFTQQPIGSSTNNTGFFNQLKAGNYTITARDQVGCTKDFPVTLIPKNSPINFDISKNLPTTCAAGDGSITVNVVNGGRQPYQYRISSQANFSASNTFSNLLGGNYFVTVADSLCSYTQAIDLSLPNSIKASYQVTPINCQTPNAVLSMQNITGGNGNYTLSLNGGAFSSNTVFSNLSPNLYAVTIQDNPLSCKSVVSMEIKEQNRADLKIIDRREVSCFGGNDGFLKALGDNSNGPFTYSINGGGYSSNPLFSNLSIGTYKITAMTGIGCIDSIRTVITQPTQLVGSYTNKLNDCFGDQTGAITLSNSGGTQPYQYSLDGNVYQSTPEFTGLLSKTYQLTTKDAKGCIWTQSMTQNQPTLVVPTTTVLKQVSCFSGNDGIVQTDATGGTLPYQYSNNGTTFINDNQFTNLAANTYTYYVKDAKGCTKTVTATVTQPPLLVPTISRNKAVNCFAGKDGILEVSNAGGTPPYEYSLDGISYQNAFQFSGLNANSYTISTKDSKGCVKTVSATVTQPVKGLEMSVKSKKNLLCYQDNTGYFDVTADGGTPSYSYAIDNTNFQTQPAFDKLAAGQYVITLKDANACLFTVTTILTEPNKLISSPVAKPNDCFGDTTGRINNITEGGTLPYQYAIDGGGFQASAEFRGLKANTYTLTTIDANNCKVVQQSTVKQPTLVTLQPIYTDTVRCNGESNAIVSLLAQGGTPGYTYSKDGNNYLADSAFKNLTAGSYNFSVKDSKGCLTKASFKATEPDKMLISLTSKANPLCAGDTNGVIKVQAVGGNAGYVYTLDSRIRNLKGVFEGLTEATYLIRATDRRGCIDDLAAVSLKWPLPLSATSKSYSPVCVGDANGSIALEVTGGVAPYSADFGKNVTLIQLSNALKLENLPAGRHDVYIADQNGCRITLPVTIAAPQSLNDITFPQPVAVCKGQEVILNANNPDRNVKWFLDQKEFSQKQDLNVVEPGLYKVEVRNETGCLKTATYQLVNSNNAMIADFLMPVQAFVGDSVYALNISSPVPDVVEWIYPSEAYSIEKNIKRGVFTVVSSGEYTIEMIAKKGECINKKQRQIQIFNRKDINQTDDQLGYKDILTFTKATAYPNPNYGNFKIDIETNKITDIEITITRSTTAALVYKTSATGKQAYSFDISLTDFVQDVYVITIRAGLVSKTIKLLIMN